GAAQLLADRTVAEQPRHPRERLEVVCPGRLRCQQHENQVDRLIVDRIEVDRRLQPGEDTVETVQVRQLAVRDADAVADARGAQALALHKYLEQRTLGLAGDFGGLL